ncbi:MAG: YncE family protein [Bacteroidia bacterium]
MERKIWLLSCLCTLYSLQINSAKAQGFVFDTCNYQFEEAFDSKDNEYFIYNLNTDSVLDIPPYSTVSRFKFIGQLHHNWYVNHNSGSYKHIAKIVKDLDVGRNVHFINNGESIVLCSPESNLLAVYSIATKSVITKTVSGMPFGLTLNKSKNEIYMSALHSRCIQVYSINTLELIDSIAMNGVSGRFINLNQENSLFVGVRSSKSISKVDLENLREISFQKTMNLPGPIFSKLNNLYYYQSNDLVLGKYDCQNLTLLESRKLTVNPARIKFIPTQNQFNIMAKRCVSINDTILLSKYYALNSLDSSGRYTWIINSYTNPKWAMAAKSAFVKNGINCYISCLNDGHYRLCAGLYKNQEDAVIDKQRLPDLFNNAWLMTIHPHKF